MLLQRERVEYKICDAVRELNYIENQTQIGYQNSNLLRYVI